MSPTPVGTGCGPSVACDRSSPGACGNDGRERHAVDFGLESDREGTGFNRRAGLFLVEWRTGGRATGTGETIDDLLYPPPLIPTTRAVALVALLVLSAALAGPGPARAQISGPIFVDPETGQETYGGNTTDPDFSPLTPEQQNWNSSNLDTTGTGTAHVGSLMHYGSRVGDFDDRAAGIRPVYLRWTAPAQDVSRVRMVEYTILPGRYSGSQPVRIVATCPGTGYESFRMYRLVQAGTALTLSGGTLDLGQPVMLEKCSAHRVSRGRKSLILRLKGTIERTADGGYVASFGPHDSPFNCGPPTWPSAAHQAAGHPPYSKWCDISVWWEVK